MQPCYCSSKVLELKVNDVKMFQELEDVKKRMNQIEGFSATSKNAEYAVMSSKKDLKNLIERLDLTETRQSKVVHDLLALSNLVERLNQLNQSHPNQSKGNLFS